MSAVNAVDLTPRQELLAKNALSAGPWYAPWRKKVLAADALSLSPQALKGLAKQKAVSGGLWAGLSAALGVGGQSLKRLITEHFDYAENRIKNACWNLEKQAYHSTMESLPQRLVQYVKGIQGVDFVEIAQSNDSKIWQSLLTSNRKLANHANRLMEILCAYKGIPNCWGNIDESLDLAEILKFPGSMIDTSFGPQEPIIKIGKKLQTMLVRSLTDQRGEFIGADALRKLNFAQLRDFVDNPSSLKVGDVTLNEEAATKLRSTVKALLKRVDRHDAIHEKIVGIFNKKLGALQDIALKKLAIQRKVLNVAQHIPTGLSAWSAVMTLRRLTQALQLGLLKPVASFVLRRPV